MNSPITNFCAVIPHALWRGAKPTTQTAQWLIDNGVNTIINLELLHDDADTLKTLNIKRPIDYFHIPTWEPFYAVAHDRADDDVIQFLAVAKLAKTPVYVHCRAGENRTGVMIAAYRIILQQENSPAQVAKVIQELQSYDGFWTTATTDYIQELALRHEEISKKVQARAVKPAITFGVNQK